MVTQVQAPWLKDLSQQELGFLQGLEMILTWQEIIKYREWALIELRIEAKRFVMSGIEVKPHNLTFTDIWVKCVDAEQIKMKNIGKNEFVKIEDIELSYKEKTGLYELLATDKNKTLISFMDGETLEKDSLKLGVNIEITAVTLILTELIQDDNLNKEREYSMLNYVNNCRCPLCLKAKANGYFDRKKTKVTSFGEQDSEKSEDFEGPERKHSVVKDELLKNGLKEHLMDIYREDNVDETKKLEPTIGRQATKKGEQAEEEKEVSENLNIVCFIEFLEFEGSVSFKRDDSILTEKPIQLGDLLIYDTSFITEMNSFELRKDFSDDYLDFFYLKYKLKFRELVGHLPNETKKSETASFAQSRILSFNVFEGSLR